MTRDDLVIAGLGAIQDHIRSRRGEAVIPGMKVSDAISSAVDAVLVKLAEDPWQPIETAPKNATTVRLRNGVRELEGHWASDLSGSEQPPFQGWFEALHDPHSGNLMYNREIVPAPTEWRPVTK